MKKLCYATLIVLGILVLLAGGSSVARAQDKTIILATTTSRPGSTSET